MKKRLPRWDIEEGTGPLLAAAIHNGHLVRREVRERFAIGTDARLREEDPFTGGWCGCADTRIVVHRSRFEADLNRARGRCVYGSPEDAWGLDVWADTPPPEVVRRSRRLHDAFYRDLRGLLERGLERHPHLVVFDLHSYNHRRSGPDAAPAGPETDPDVNLGTGTMVRAEWAPVVDAFLEAMRSASFPGKPHPAVGENVKFRGGYMPRWIHEHFPGRVCALAIEFKKFFMDEWTGQPLPGHLEAIQHALRHAAGAVLAALGRLPRQ